MSHPWHKRKSEGCSSRLPRRRLEERCGVWSPLQGLWACIHWENWQDPTQEAGRAPIFSCQTQHEQWHSSPRQGHTTQYRLGSSQCPDYSPPLSGEESARGHSYPATWSIYVPGLWSTTEHCMETIRTHSHPSPPPPPPHISESLSCPIHFTFSCNFNFSLLLSVYTVTSSLVFKFWVVPSGFISNRRSSDWNVFGTIQATNKLNKSTFINICVYLL